MINSLSLVLCVVMLFYLIRGPIDHKKCLVFGTLYYLIIPVVVGENFNFIQIQNFDKWFEVYDTVTNNQKLFFLLNALFMVQFYIAGSVISRCHVKEKKYIESKILFKSLSLGNTGSILVGMTAFAFSLLIWGASKELFFKGYTDTYNTDLMGQMATLNLVLLITIFMSVGIFRKILTLLLLSNSVFLLSMGGRMYVITCALFIIFYFFDKQKLPKLLLALLLMLCASLVLTGMLRVGNTNGFNDFMYIALAEPLFTNFSALSFLVIPENFNVINFPLGFLNSFLMIAPNIMDYKQYIHVGADSMGFVYNSPLGATSIFVSLEANFGILGTYAFMFVLGYVVNKCQVSNNLCFRSVYLMSCSVLPFMFFRDDFSIVHKVVFFTGLIIPLIYITISNLLILLKGK